MFKVEEKLVDLIRKYFWVILILVGLVGGIYARRQGLYLQSNDWNDYLLPWMTTLDENTGFKGLAIDFSTYYIPYMCVLAIGTYLDPSKWLIFIKITSIISEILFSAAAALIARKLIKDRGGDERWAAAVFAIFMLSPMVMLNGAYWGQCDYVYSAFVMLGIYFFLDEKYIAAMNMIGIAFAFKQQALIVLPVIVLVWLCNKSFSLWKLVFIPIWYLIGGLPAIIAGRPAGNVYRIYLNQANEFGQLSMNLPNIYRFFPNTSKEDFFKWGMYATVVILFVLALWVIQGNYRLSKRAILGLFMACTGVCGMFIPALHERYLSLYVGVTYLYFLVYDKKKTVLAGVLDTLVCITYFLNLYGINRVDQYPYLAVVHLGILFYIIYEVVNVIKKEQGESIQ
ncbi:hypothetical protein [Butyrivibrio proteoclasticus]|uniref:hypothetical protein n=1 Tax=Butyrivibrio proteoclasticus TaxID=43305 RepID=UPI00047BDE37|nr:hypothetical protein [Butyrivibrio proteoclasticus]